MPSLHIRQLTSLANEAKARGVTVNHLNIGQSNLLTIYRALEAYNKR